MFEESIGNRKCSFLFLLCTRPSIIPMSIITAASTMMIPIPTKVRSIVPIDIMFDVMCMDTQYRYTVLSHACRIPALFCSGSSSDVLLAEPPHEPTPLLMDTVQFETIVSAVPLSRIQATVNIDTVKG